MAIVMLTRPDGKPVAINAAQWHTITADISDGKDRSTQIGFAGMGTPLYVREKYEDVVKRFAEADKDSPSV